MLGPVDWEPRVGYYTVFLSHFHLGKEIILQACRAAALSFPFSSFELFNKTIRPYLWFPCVRSCYIIIITLYRLLFNTRWLHLV